jgi:uncharacterized protein DUF5677
MPDASEDLQAQVVAVRRLVAYAYDHVAPNLKPKGDVYDTVIVAALFARGTSTTEAILLLAEHGFGQQAMMLNRSLYEHMVDAHWAHDNWQLARERLVQHAQLHWHLRRETAARHPDVFGAVADAEALPADRLQELKRVFGKHGVKSWTGLNMQERVTAIESLFQNECSRLWQVHDVLHNLNNAEIHPSAWSLGCAARRVPQRGGGEMVQLRMGPEPELVSSAVGNAWWSYGHLLALVHDAFALPLQPLHELSDEDASLFLGGHAAAAAPVDADVTGSDP